MNELNRIANASFVKSRDDNGGAFSKSAEMVDWDIHSLINLIVTGYHFDLRQQVLKIYDLANDVFIKCNDQYPELAKLVESLFLFFGDLLFQFKKEEQILFPNILQLKEKKLDQGAFSYSTFGVISEYALAMRKEHQVVFEQLQVFRRLTNDYKETENMRGIQKRLYAKMKRFEQELTRHIHLERDILIPRAIQMDGN